MKRTIRVTLASGSYPIYLGTHIRQTAGKLYAKLGCGNFTVIVTNQTILSLYKRTLRKMFKKLGHTVVLVPDSERAKSKKWLFYLLKELHKNNKLGRKLSVTCFGGGVVGDLAAFAASIYKRGIPCVQIPTTFLAQIDASIGGKTAIDFENVKNSIGSFYQPKAVIIDPVFLKTLPLREIRQGIAEAVKYGAIRSRPLFVFLENNSPKIQSLKLQALERIIYECAHIKADIVSRDERETKGIRTILNFGHTIGHALEGAGKFTGVTHGEAVAMGMVVSAHISYDMGLLSRKNQERLLHLIASYNLVRPMRIDAAAVMRALRHDKKFIHGRVRMVLLKGIAQAKIVEDIPLDLIKKSLQHVVT